MPCHRDKCLQKFQLPCLAYFDSILSAKLNSEDYIFFVLTGPTTHCGGLPTHVNEYERHIKHTQLTYTNTQILGVCTRIDVTKIPTQYHLWFGVCCECEDGVKHLHCWGVGPHSYLLHLQQHRQTTNQLQTENTHMSQYYCMTLHRL
jgi:hypothetical protein